MTKIEVFMIVNDNLTKFYKDTLPLGTKASFIRNNTGIIGTVYCINPVCKTYDIIDEEGVLHKDVDYEDVKTI